MARFILCFTLFILLVIYIHINECKPIFFPPGYVDQQGWAKAIGIPVDHLARAHVPHDSEQESMEGNRLKRNCLTYPGQRFHQISKWMCW